MGFDPQTENQPLVNVKKRTTKVNVAMTIGVIVFLIIASVIMFKFMLSPAETQNEMHQEQVQP